LSKVQLLQKQGKANTKQVGQMLLEVHNIVQPIVHNNFGKYRDVMQADLWDFLSSTPHSFLPKKGLLQQPIEGGGAAAGAKSYNSASGQIFGILNQMKDEFTKNLGNAQKEELRAMLSFQNLKSAKQQEMDAATGLKDKKTAELAQATQDDAQAKQDLEDTQAALSADQKFLIELKKNCKIADEEYAARSKARGDEVVALGEALKILTSDENRDLWGKTMSFLQIGSVNSKHSSHAVGSSRTNSGSQNMARTAAVKRILATAKKTKNWQLATLAVSVQLDAFVKVKEAMDKMLAELKKQQKEEYEKHDFCKAEIDANEDQTKEKTHEKNDLDDKHAELSNTIKVLTQDIEGLKTEIGEMQVSLKRAGEDRKAENVDFQAQVSDQRAVVSILNKVLDRLKEFYEKKSLVQVGAHNHQAEDPPPSPKAYEKSGGAGGVMQLIAKIIEDAEKEEAELVVDEQNAQEGYASFVQETNSCMAACQQSITEKEEALSASDAAKAETETALLAVNAELTSLKDLNIGLHKDCDFLLENFETRQTARKQEMDAIVEAKAILSGSALQFSDN